jgi:hypothetical protein
MTGRESDPMDLLTTRKRLEDGRQILAELRGYL